MKLKKIKFKKILPNLILLFFTLIFCLFIIEVVVRNLDRAQFEKNSIYIISDYSIFTYKPNAHIQYERLEFPVDVKINSKGIRDYEYEYEKENGVKRIEMFGDSMTAAYQVPLEKTFSKKLEGLLNKNTQDGFKYGVLNMGLSGTGPTPHVILFEKEGIKYDPDIVIFNIYVGNDFISVDIGVSGFIPQEIFENSTSVEGVNFEVTNIQKLKNFIFRNYFTHIYLMKFINNIRFDRANDLAFVELEIYKKNYTENAEKSLEKFKILFKHLKRYTDSNGIDFLVVLIPTKQQVDERKFSEMVLKYKLNESELEVKKAQEILLQFGRENNITMLDLLPDFSKRNKNNTFYFGIDGHWNERGHELATNLIYEKLISERFVTS